MRVSDTTTQEEKNVHEDELPQTVESKNNDTEATLAKPEDQLETKDKRSDTVDAAVEDIAPSTSLTKAPVQAVTSLKDIANDVGAEQAPEKATTETQTGTEVQRLHAELDEARQQSASSQVALEAAERKISSLTGDNQTRIQELQLKNEGLVRENSSLLSQLTSSRQRIRELEDEKLALTEANEKRGRSKLSRVAPDSVLPRISRDFDRDLELEDISFDGSARDPNNPPSSLQHNLQIDLVFWYDKHAGDVIEIVTVKYCQLYPASLHSRPRTMLNKAIWLLLCVSGILGDQGDRHDPEYSTRHIDADLLSSEQNSPLFSETYWLSNWAPESHVGWVVRGCYTSDACCEQRLYSSWTSVVRAWMRRVYGRYSSEAQKSPIESFNAQKWGDQRRASFYCFDTRLYVKAKQKSQHMMGPFFLECQQGYHTARYTDPQSTISGDPKEKKARCYRATDDESLDFIPRDQPRGEETKITFKQVTITTPDGSTPDRMMTEALCASLPATD
ncbi:hypothetical protein MRB53_039149 [Persea americana]|nr:hypothetical protein MRB53_039149 [Persea americana]